MVREKAKRLYAHLKEPDGSFSGECTDGEFKVSEGWFKIFKVRQSLHNIKIVGEAASADTAAAGQYSEEFANLVADGGYKPEQVFWARTTCQCFGVLIRKRGLQALFFVTGSGIVLFLKLKALLVLDNAPGHPRKLETMHPNIKVKFLPPNTSALLQTMDQGIIQAFKLYYIRRTYKIILDNMECNPDMDIMECWKKLDIAKCIVNIKESLEELKSYTLRSWWKKLWPAVTAENDVESVSSNFDCKHNRNREWNRTRWIRTDRIK